MATATINSMIVNPAANFGFMGIYLALTVNFVAGFPINGDPERMNGNGRLMGVT